MRKSSIAVAALATTLALGGCAAGGQPPQGTEAESSSASTASSQAQVSEQASAAAASEAQASSTSEDADEGSPLSKSQVTQLIESNGYGSVISLEQEEIGGVWYWQVVASLEDGSVHQYLVDPDGTVSNEDEDAGAAAKQNSTTNANRLSENDVDRIVREQGLGDLTSAKLDTLDDGVQYWQIVTRDANGKKTTYVIDPSGNVSKK